MLALPASRLKEVVKLIVILNLSIKTRIIFWIGKVNQITLDSPKLLDKLVSIKTLTSFLTVTSIHRINQET